MAPTRYEQSGSAGRDLGILRCCAQYENMQRSRDEARRSQGVERMWNFGHASNRFCLSANKFIITHSRMRGPKERERVSE